MSFKYSEASRELEGILRDLESDRLDVDEMVAKAQRAAELIKLCRERISEAKIQVKTLTSTLIDE